MFFVINKKKIASYLISLGLVVVLFATPFVLNKNSKDTIKTNGKIIKNETLNIEKNQNKVLNSINSIKSEENSIKK